MGGIGKDGKPYPSLMTTPLLPTGRAQLQISDKGDYPPALSHHTSVFPKSLHPSKRPAGMPDSLIEDVSVVVGRKKALHSDRVRTQEVPA